MTKRWFRLVLILVMIGISGYKLSQIVPDWFAAIDNSFYLFFLLIVFLLIALGIYRVLRY